MTTAWLSPALLTLQLILVSGAIAGLLGVISAWAVSTLASGGSTNPLLDRWLLRIFLLASITAVALPLILHAAAWEATAGKFGWLPLTQTGSRTFGQFGGLVAAGWIHGLVGVPIVALATWHGAARVPGAVVEAARMDAGPLARWWRIGVPIGLPWLLASLLGVTLLAATEMTVVNLYGFRTIADEFYLFYAADPTGSSVLAVCLVPALVGGCLMAAVWAARRGVRSLTALPATAATAEAEGGLRHIADPEAGRGWGLAGRRLARVWCLGISLLIAAVPLAGLVVKAGHEVTVDAERLQVRWSPTRCAANLAAAPATFAEEYGWTAALALLAGSASLLIAWPLARLARTRPGWGRLTDGLSILAVVIPGPVVGIVVVRLFQFDSPALRAIYQQSLLPTTLALLVRSAPVAYWVLRAAYDNIGGVVLDSARLDAGSWRRLWSIEAPLLGRRIFWAAFAAAVVASGDVPATLPVAPPGVQTVGTRLFGLLHSGARYQEAALAFWYLAAIVTVAGILAAAAPSKSRRV